MHELLRQSHAGTTCCWSVADWRSRAMESASALNRARASDGSPWSNACANCHPARRRPCAETGFLRSGRSESVSSRCCHRVVENYGLSAECRRATASSTATSYTSGWKSGPVNGSKPTGHGADARQSSRRWGATEPGLTCSTSMAGAAPLSCSRSWSRSRR